MNLENMTTAADTANAQAGGAGFFQGVADLATYGVGAAAVSGAYSLANTAIAFGNMLGMNKDYLDTQKTLLEVDKNWADYYARNKTEVDAVGFIATSFIPGGLAVKGLRMAQEGRALGTFGNALGYTVRTQERLLGEGLTQLASRSGTTFAGVNTAKMGAMAAGAGQAMLESAVFETAAALTMVKSPFLEGEDFYSMVKGGVVNFLVGGAIGGAIGSLLVGKLFKDASKTVDRSLRRYDSVANLERQGLSFGDTIYSQLDEILNLPAGVLAEDAVIPFAYKWNGKTVSMELDTTKLATARLADTVKNAQLKMQEMIGKVLPSDPTVGQPLAAAVTQILLKAGDNVAEARTAAGNLLHYLKDVKGLYSDEVVDFSKEVVYLSPGASFSKAGAVGDLLTSVPHAADAQGYRIVGDIAKTRVAVVGLDARNADAAFFQGFDWFVDKAGTISINPASEIYQATRSANTNLRKVYNPHTNTVTDRAIPTVGDVATAAKPVRATASGISSGNYTWEFQANTVGSDKSTVRISARHLWASNYSNFNGKVLQPTDFSLLDRLMEDPNLRKAPGLKIADSTGLSTPEILADYSNWLLERKYVEAKALLGSGGDAGMDLREVAIRINAEPQWVEQALAQNFDPERLAQIPGMSRKLASYGARDNLILTYDSEVMKKMETDGFQVQGEVAYRQRVKEAQENSARVAAAVLKDQHKLFLDVPTEDLLRKADSTGTGATAFGASNAGYDDKLRLFAQDTGKNLHLVGNMWREEATAALRPAAEKLMGSETASRQFVALRSRLQLTDTLMALHPDDHVLVDLASLKKYQGLRSEDDQARFAFKTTIPVEPEVYDFLEAHHKLHAGVVDGRRLLAAASGTPLHWSPEALYLPPIDTKRVPFFAFVQRKDGALFGTSDVAMITARDQAELDRLASNIDANVFDVHFKKDTEAYFKAKQNYEYSKALNQPSIDPYLRKQGKLGDFMPSFDIKAHVEDFIQSNGKRTQELAREAVQVRYAQLFNELQWLSSQNTKTGTSVFQYFGKTQQRNVQDPFGDYIRTALNISKQSEYTLWSQLNEFVDAVGTRAYRAVEGFTREARAGNMTWEQANTEMERMGLPGPFKDQKAFWDSFTSNDRNLIKEAVGKAHAVLANFGLRFDIANSIVQTMSTPILLATEVSSIKRAVDKDPALAGALAELITVRSPTGVAVPSATKLMGNSISTYFTEEGKVLMARYKEIGAVRDIVSQHFDMVNDLSSWNTIGASKWSKLTDKWVEKVSTLTGNNFSEDFSRFLAADAMRQISQPLVDASKMTLKEQNALISVMANRVHGNYVASQRPIAFQGTVGAAVGLFQTYQFNLMQQLFRHIENRDTRTLAIAGALQTSLFGVSGLPLFDAVNTHIIGNASMNEGHRDVYSTAVKLAGKEAGDWLLYGTASAFPMFSDKAPALYTRGDLNPRHVSVLPITPADLPVVQLADKLATTFASMGRQVVNGADLSSAFLHGLEHQGLSRPLAGLAQVIQGYSTTGEGNLASSNDMVSISSAARLLGARPMDESIALNANFRVNAYRAADKARLDELGSVVKDKIRKGNLSEEDVHDFMGRYAAAGGRVEGYGEAMQRWTKGATQSTVNILMDAQHNVAGQRLMEIMGADKLPDLQSKQQQQLQ